MDPIQSPQQTRKIPVLLLYITLGVVSFISIFGGGVFLGREFAKEQPKVNADKIPTVIPSLTIVPTVSEEEVPVPPEFSNTFLPGKHYFNDTIFIVVKTKPHVTLVATASRIQADDGSYSQDTRVSFYNGEKWVRTATSAKNADSSIGNSNLVPKWEVTYDKSKVLKQTVSGQVKVDGKTITYTTPVLENEIPMRSLPGYTKFLSEAKGTVMIDGVYQPAYFLYSRIYSLNAADIQFYNQPFGLTTDWVAFWDENGNFYHIDKTEVDKPTDIYDTHTFVAKKDTEGRIQKSFALNVTRSSETPPEKYTFSLGSIGENLTFTLINSQNKALNRAYDWYMGQVQGTVAHKTGTVNGVGLVEYIHN